MYVLIIHSIIVSKPTAELQAAGRIHRLGQTKGVMVKRFAFRDSMDSNILTLHQDVESGRITIVRYLLYFLLLLFPLRIIITYFSHSLHVLHVLHTAGRLL